MKINSALSFYNLLEKRPKVNAIFGIDGGFRRSKHISEMFGGNLSKALFGTRDYS
jgi:hypothetical protein